MVKQWGTAMVKQRGTAMVTQWGTAMIKQWGTAKLKQWGTKLSRRILEVTVEFSCFGSQTRNSVDPIRTKVRALDFPKKKGQKQGPQNKNKR